jgi:hypothetical protein
MTTKLKVSAKHLNALHIKYANQRLIQSGGEWRHCQRTFELLICIKYIIKTKKSAFVNIKNIIYSQT